MQYCAPARGRLDIDMPTLRIVKHLTLILLVMAASALPALAQPRLILLTQSNLRNPDGSEVRVYPSYIKTKVSVIETLPFDGIAFHSPSGRTLMDGTLHSTATLANEWAPLKGVQWTRMKHNFAVVNVDRPNDFFDDWSATIQSFQNLAVALRDAGIQGILFDNEEYQRDLWHYPANVSYASSHSLSDYYAQARLRGGQIISAVQAVYPDIEFMVLLSPADNCPATPDLQTAWTRDPNNLAGAFTVGLMEQSTKPIVDGNEVSYNYRTQAEFDASYRWRRYDMATKCPYIPTSFQASWSNRISISQAVYNRPITYANGVYKDMNPTIMRQNLGMALRGVDRYAWLYWEGGNWYNPVGSTYGVPKDWYDAVEQSWLATRSLPSPPTNLRIIY
jgi:hypothetical protein